jgi:hypothetical protein
VSDPKRRPIPLIDTSLRHIGERLTKVAPEMELGWSALKAELKDVGWPSRTPEDDRKPNTGQSEPSVLDYLDPTGELSANKLTAMSDDLQAMQDHRHIVETSLRAIELIAARHRPLAAPCTPCCATCGETVEQRKLSGGKVSYVNVELIAGVWCAKPGTKAACRKHRARAERDVA